MTKNGLFAINNPFFILVGQSDVLAVRLEQKRNAPYTGKGDYGIDYSAQYLAAAAEEPCHKVKAEEPDESPVETADNGKYKTYSVKHIFTSLTRKDAEKTMFSGAFCQIRVTLSYFILFS